MANFSAEDCQRGPGFSHTDALGVPVRPEPSVHEHDPHELPRRTPTETSARDV